MPFVLSSPDQNHAMLRVSAAAALAVGGVAALVLALRLDGKDSKGKKKSAAAPTSPTSSSLAAARKYRANSNPESRVNSNSNNNSNANANNLDTPQQLVYKHAAVDDMHGTSETTCLVFVGMPGRGKTAMAKRTAQYLSFFHGIACQVFSVADRRRAALGYVPEDYYGDDNEEGARMRARFNQEALDALKLYLVAGRDGSARVAILDGSNHTRKQRFMVYEELKKLGNVEIIFVEMISEATLTRHEDMAPSDISSAKKAMEDHDAVTADYKKRVARFFEQYEPIASENDDSGGDGTSSSSSSSEHDHESDFSYIKCVEFGTKVVLNNIKGYMPGRIAQFLCNTSRCHWERNPAKRLVLSRHGQSEFNLQGRIGGDTGLTEAGEAYGVALAKYAEEHICTGQDENGEPVAIPARLWTSSLQRTQLTARHIKGKVIMQDGYPFKQMKKRVFKNLDEIYAGACDGMTYEEIQSQFGAEAACRKADKLSYRYPRGESYLDVIQRLEPLVHEIERHRESLLIVGHQGVLRMILAYFQGVPREEAPHLSLALNHVLTLKPRTYGCVTTKTNLMASVQLVDDGQEDM